MNTKTKTQPCANAAATPAPKGKATVDAAAAAQKATDRKLQARAVAAIGQLQRAEKAVGTALVAAAMVAVDGFRYTSEFLAEHWPSLSAASVPVYASDLNLPGVVAARIGRARVAEILASNGWNDAKVILRGVRDEAAKLDPGRKLLTEEQAATATMAGVVRLDDVRNAKTAKRDAAKTTATTDAAAKADASAQAAEADPLLPVRELLAALSAAHAKGCAAAANVPEGRRGAFKDGMAHLSRAVEAFAVATKK